MRTLVVEDEKHLNRMISEAILDEGYSVDSCFNGLEALELCECAEYDVIVLDIMMPKMDGFELVRRLRADGCKTPVVYLTSRDSVSDKVRGLESGGDYYMVKPFDFRELIAVIHVMARKSGDNHSNIYELSDLTLDIAAKQVTRGGKVIAYRLFPFDPESRSESVQLDLFISGSYDGPDRVPGSWIYVTSLSGTVEVTTGGEVYRLESRDCLSFPGSQSNYAAALAITMAVITMAIAYAVQLNSMKEQMK